MKKILLFIGLVVTNLLATAQQANVVIDPSFNAGAQSISISLLPDGKIMSGGGYGSLKRLNDNGTQDNSFNIGTGFNINGTIWTNATQQDGKVIAGGLFYVFNGLVQNKIIRLNYDGSKDNSFNVGTGFADGIVFSTVIQPDGKVLVGGSFTSFNGYTSNRLIRLHSDGARDWSLNIGTGFDEQIRSIILQPDGKILACGGFTSYKGITQNRLIRLNADGTRDANFNIGAGFNDTVYTIALQPDGKIIAGGMFTSFNGIAQNRLIRLTSDGSYDSSFNLGINFADKIEAIKIKPDGKVLLGANNYAFNGVTQNGLLQLNADGTHDTNFNLGTGISGYVQSIELQPDGKILIGSYLKRLIESTSNNPNLNNYLATYPFNGNTNDESGNNYHAANNGAVLTMDRNGNSNKAYDFNGTSNYIQFPSSIGTGVTTVSMWFKPTSSQDNQIILRNRMYGYEVAYNKVYDGTDRANKLSTKLYINNSSGSYNEYTYIHPTNLNLNQWYHIAFTYDGNYYKVYLNNVMVYQSNSFGTGTVKNENSGAGYVLGRDGDTPYWYFKGSIDDLSVWGRALSGSELNTIYTGGTLNSTDFENSESLNLYPNPTKDILHIKVPVNICITTCELIDISGKMIKARISNNSIDVSQLQKGMYLIKLETSEGFLTEKFIKE